MLFCLEEGIKTKDQITWGKAAAVFLFRDERHSRLLIRFRAVGERLLTTSGVLGQERDFGTGAHNLLRATRNIMVRACTRFHGAPTPGKSFVKWSLFQHLRKIVTGIALDSAADEVLCAEMMRDPALANTRAALTPHLRHILRDKAHATRRLISRPWGVLMNSSKVLSCSSAVGVGRWLDSFRIAERTNACLQTSLTPGVVYRGL